MMSDQDLKPCPFCGGEAFTQVFEPHSHSLEFIPDYPGSASVECANCPCGILKDTLDEAIMTWNTRTPDPMLEELAGALEEIARCLSHGLQDCRASIIAKDMLGKYQQSKVQP